MARPIRIEGVELDPKMHLPAEKFQDYEDLEKRHDALSPWEKKYYDLLQRWAYLHYVLQVKQMDAMM